MNLHSRTHEKPEKSDSRKARRGKQYSIFNVEYLLSQTTFTVHKNGSPRLSLPRPGNRYSRATAANKQLQSHSRAGRGRPVPK